MTTEAVRLEPSHTNSVLYAQLRDGPFQPPASCARWCGETVVVYAEQHIQQQERSGHFVRWELSEHGVADLGETVRHRP